MIKKNDSESILNLVKPELNNMIAKKQGLKNYLKYNSKTKSDLIKLILKEELDVGDWFNKLNRLNIKKLKSIAEKLVEVEI
jgi:hypothetical protein